MPTEVPATGFTLECDCSRGAAWVQEPQQRKFRRLSEVCSFHLLDEFVGVRPAKNRPAENGT